MKLAEFQVVARAHGTVDSTGLVDELGLPVGGLAEGQSDYSVDLLFPVLTNAAGNANPIEPR